jgi:hypothetical protein
LSKAKRQRAAATSKPWWSKRRNRNRVWLGLFGTLVIAVVALFVWFATQGSMGTPEAKTGQQVEAFALPDVVSGETFSLADYLGKQDIVLVSYMGFF